MGVAVAVAVGVGVSVNVGVSVITGVGVTVAVGVIVSVGSPTIKVTSSYPLQASAPVWARTFSVYSPAAGGDQIQRKVASLPPPSAGDNAQWRVVQRPFQLTDAGFIGTVRHKFVWRQRDTHPVQRGVDPGFWGVHAREDERLPGSFRGVARRQR